MDAHDVIYFKWLIGHVYHHQGEFVCNVETLARQNTQGYVSVRLRALDQHHHVLGATASVYVTSLSGRYGVRAYVITSGT